MLKKRPKKEQISKKTIEHSSLGEFTKGDKKRASRLKSGGHGEENIQELNRRGIEYNITKQYPNGVRVGNVPTHKDKQKRDSNKQTWFPKSRTRKTIKKAGEKVINSTPYKLSDGMNAFGIYKKVKVVVMRTNGGARTVYPYYKQSGGKGK